MLVEYKGKRKIIGIPVFHTKDATKTDEFIVSQINCKDYKILKNKVPLNTELLFNNQRVLISGYSIAHKGNELRNFVELKIRKENYIKWKFTLNRLLNNKKDAINDLEYKEDLIEILKFLLTLQDKYPLVDGDLSKIKDYFNKNIDLLELERLENFTKQVLLIFNSSKKTASLSNYKLKNEMGRLADKKLTQGTIIYKSITGIREKKYEF